MFSATLQGVTTRSKEITYTKAKGLVSIIPTLLQLSAVFQLLVLRELKHLGSDGKLAIDLFLCESKINDIKES